MFCEKCGAKIEEGTKFCSNCGRVVNMTEVDTDGVMPKEENVAKPRKNKKFIPVIIGAVVVFVAVFLVIINLKPTINLNDYLTIEESGYDGYGTLQATIDWNGIEEKYGEKISIGKQAKKEFGGFASMMTPTDMLQEKVSVHLDKISELRNGEEVAYTWEVSDDISGYVDCKVKHKDGTYEVSGLEDVKTFDLFKDLQVEFSGVAPNGSASVIYNGTRYYTFQCDKSDGLSNGDKIVVSVENLDVEYHLNNEGEIPEATEKEYVVEGLNSYVTELSQVDDEVLEKLQKQAVDEYNAKVARDWGEEESLEDFAYLGNYLLTKKVPNSGGGNNYLYLIYKAQVRDTYTKNNETFDETKDIYWYICFHDLMMDPEGQLEVEVNDYDTPSDRVTIDSGLSGSWFSTKSWYYYGYETLDNLYENVITANADSFNHEEMVDESLVQVAEESDEENYEKDGHYSTAMTGDENGVASMKMEGDELHIVGNFGYSESGREESTDDYWEEDGQGSREYVFLTDNNTEYLGYGEETQKYSRREFEEDFCTKPGLGLSLDIVVKDGVVKELGFTS